MLKLLRIRDFALIRSLEMEFEAGLCLLTGETGSGKSIIVDALGLLTGGRSSPDLIRSGSDSAVIEGLFGCEGSAEISRILGQAGIAEEEELVIRREISSAGRSRVFVNDCVVTLSLMRTLGQQLAGIHGQQDQLSLLESSAHQQWLDRFGQNQQLAAEVRRLFEILSDTAHRLDSLRSSEQERKRRMDMLQFQINEIRGVNPRAGEKQELERERRILANREKIFSLTSQAYGLVHESEPSVIDQFRRTVRMLRELEDIDSQWEVHRQFLEEAVYRLEDLAAQLRDYQVTADYSPEMLDRLEQRIAELDKLTGKYGHSLEIVLQFADNCERELDELQNCDETFGLLEARLSADLAQYRTAAERLSRKRRADGLELQRALRREFRSLALEKMKLAVKLERAGEEMVRDNAIRASWSALGMDQVEFMVSPNLGEPLKALARIASGGELSRVMLAIQAVCGEDKGKTLVFDEVDAGIGGRVAESVGRRLRRLAETNQVLCVTHLPQIAAFADQHYCVTKEVVSSRTETFARALDMEERVEELARMMGGESITDITRRHAREFLAEASSAGRAAR